MEILKHCLREEVSELTGRHLTGRPFSFRNEAAHLFMSNHLITTSDHSEPFYARWLLVEFIPWHAERPEGVDCVDPELVSGYFAVGNLL